MKADIILAGVGGQGILSIAASIGMAALENNLQIKQAEVHGMSQRGGAVHSNMRISSTAIASDLIPRAGADLILSVEPMESLRYLPWLSKNGWLVTNINPFVNIPDYPDPEALKKKIEALPNHIYLDADKIASELGSGKVSNMVILGAATPFIDIPYHSFEKGIQNIFGRKGKEIVALNMEALRRGKEVADLSLN
ncbi:MAG: indolepyruvate oxidoreductase subunit beta [Gammaproteobacteria bacterium]|nr:indolepyruvate oxidoreductase subunit beta [Gammaproteobacteria bacterium]